MLAIHFSEGSRRRLGGRAGTRLGKLLGSRLVVSEVDSGVDLEVIWSRLEDKVEIDRAFWLEFDITSGLRFHPGDFHELWAGTRAYGVRAHLGRIWTRRAGVRTHLSVLDVLGAQESRRLGVTGRNPCFAVPYSIDAYKLWQRDSRSLI